MKKPRDNSLEKKIAERIAHLPYSVILREDFEDLGGYDQVGRALRILAAKGQIVKIGYGLYAKTTISILNGKIVPANSLPKLAKEALMRLGVEIAPSSFELAYNSGRSTQVPTGRMIAVKGRVSRKIGYLGNYVNYERIPQQRTV